MRDLVLCYLVWSGMVATLTAPGWVQAQPRPFRWRRRIVALICIWTLAGIWFPASAIWGAGLGLLDAIRGRS